ncbi:hypothetical protein FNV43_RR04073 [Rhamnella rubrinervis]|uniref:AAA+ ATPase domain-containing protein n=1 Tax=Rhamnella rubrinervis TaxID=2594499 RepID=A0A8K0HIW5_9ROSA|nr:hypothetical protein FNV43_RR04073 [Rhamnella rubrinervis]
MELLGLLALSLGIHLLDLPEKAEKVRAIWRFIGEFPEWLNYHKQLDEKVKTLNRKKDNLSALEEDVKTGLEHAELKPGKKRKREVEIWFRDVQSKKNDVLSVERQIGEGRLLLRPWLERRVEKTIQEVDELCDRGKFPEGLILDAHVTSREPFPTSLLVGDISTTIIRRVSQWLVGDEVSIIGIHGDKGVGKSEILMHIHNRILESSEHVYWVTVSQYPNIRDLQDAIAKEVGIDSLNEEDTRRRAATLFKALKRRGKSVLFLDDIPNPLKLDEIGIPDQASACKLVLTARSPRVCRMMGRQTIEVTPLSDEEAVDLFKQKVHHRNDPVPASEEIIKRIVKQCKGLPRLIIDAAERMRGVHDRNQWNDAANEAIESRGDLID